MINFRYHIVSLMAVFLALAVGIVLGVTLLSDAANSTIVAQATADRSALQSTRSELTRLKALNDYRDTYAGKVSDTLTNGTLQGDNVALVVMPDAPAAVVRNIAAAVDQAGGTVVSQVEINQNVYDTAQAADVEAVVGPLAKAAGAPDNATLATRFGAVLGTALLDKTMRPADDASRAALNGLTDARLVSVSDRVTQRAGLVVVVTAAAPDPTDPQPGTDVLTAHLQTDVALRRSQAGVVVAGPNSGGTTSTDIALIRSPGANADDVSTVDVADLPSGVTTTVLALREQQLGEQGHYGAFGDAALPDLPVR